MLNKILWDKHTAKETKLMIYKSIVESTILYASEIWKLKKNLKLNYWQQKWTF